MRILVSTKRIAVVEFVAGQVAFGFQSETTGLEFGPQFLLLAGKSPELGLSGLVRGQPDQKVPEKAGDGSLLLGRLDASRVVEVVVDTDGDILHDQTIVTQFHSEVKLTAKRVSLGTWDGRSSARNWLLHFAETPLGFPHFSR